MIGSAQHLPLRQWSTREECMATEAAVYEKPHSGWVTFAAILMFAVGIDRIISAISYFANSVRINNLANGAFHGHLWVYGIWDLCIAIFALLAGASLLGNGGFGRMIAYIWAVLVIVQGFVIIGEAPWYATLMIVLAVLVIFGLSKTAESIWDR
jgi:hypothetical protein